MNFSLGNVSRRTSIECFLLQLRMDKTKNLVSSSIVISERLLYTINQPLLALEGVRLRRKIRIKTFGI